MGKTFFNNVRYAVRPDKPLLTARLAWRYLRARVQKEPPTRYVDFALDYRCNLFCQHCFAEALKNPERVPLTQPEYKEVIRQCLELGVVNFSFQGGEPMLFMDRLEEVISYCQPQLSVISVTTNGTLLTPENIRRLKRARVDILTISIDSLSAEEHDQFRAKDGTLSKVLEGVDRALAAGLRVTVGTVVSHHNVRSPGLEKVFAYSTEKRLNCALALAVPLGSWSEALDVLLTPEDQRYLDAMRARHPHVRLDTESNWHKQGCGAMKEIMYFTPYGDLLSCPFVHVSFGNVRESSVREIRAQALKRYDFLRRYHDKCLCATDTDFIQTYLLKTRSMKPYPPTADQVFADYGKSSPDKK